MTKLKDLHNPMGSAEAEAINKNWRIRMRGRALEWWKEATKIPFIEGEKPKKRARRQKAKIKKVIPKVVGPQWQFWRDQEQEEQRKHFSRHNGFTLGKKK